MSLSPAGGEPEPRKKMNNSHSPQAALRRRRRRSGEAAPSGEAASWLQWKGELVYCAFPLISCKPRRGPAGWETQAVTVARSLTPPSVRSTMTWSASKSSRSITARRRASCASTVTWPKKPFPSHPIDHLVFMAETRVKNFFTCLLKLL